MVNIAIENSVRYEREKRRARYFRLLLAISSELDPRRSVNEMLPLVTDRVRSGFRTEACQIYLRTEEDIHRVALRAGSGIPESLVGEVTYMTGEGLTGYILASGTSIQIRDPAAAEGWDDPYIGEIARYLPSGVYRSYLGVPLKLGSEILGTLELINKVPSAPGHRDWFTDDDEEYLRLLSTAIGGVLEGARYLKTLSAVSVTTMRMQRVASFGTLAQRILHETANPLAVARLAATNLRNNMADVLSRHSVREDTGGKSGVPDPEQSAHLVRRLDIIDTSMNEVSGKLLDLLKCSQRIGFVRTSTQWNDVVREVLIWLAAERQRRGVETHVIYGDLPPLLIESNELFGVLATVLHLTMETLGSKGGLMEVQTSLSADGRCVRTESRAPEAPGAKRVISILKSSAGEPEKLSPLHFEWALAQETTESQYGGTLTWKADDGKACFVLELPVGEN
jgi:signal transduction histidine kinase